MPDPLGRDDQLRLLADRHPRLRNICLDGARIAVYWEDGTTLRVVVDTSGAETPDCPVLIDLEDATVYERTPTCGREHPEVPGWRCDYRPGHRGCHGARRTAAPELIATWDEEG